MVFGCDAGVISVTSDADKNQLVVTGDGVDFFLLMKSLKRKFRCASIVSIEEVKPPEKKDDKKDDKKDEKKKEECCKICCCPCPCACPPPGYNNPCVQYYPFSSFRHLNACGRDLPSEGGGRAVGVSDGEIDGGDEFGRVVGDEDCLRNEGTGSDLLRL
nr:heavy metal-associated isoprenylated plant protein 16-like [Ipomoea trifida]